MKYWLTNLIPLNFRSTTRLTGFSNGETRQIDYWWQWRDRVFGHKVVQF